MPVRNLQLDNIVRRLWTTTKTDVQTQCFVNGLLYALHQVNEGVWVGLCFP